MLFLKAFYEASTTKGKPTAILAKTFKGKNFPDIEDTDNWHGKPLGDEAQIVIEVSICYIFVCLKYNNSILYIDCSL